MLGNSVRDTAVSSSRMEMSFLGMAYSGWSMMLTTVLVKEVASNSDARVVSPILTQMSAADLPSVQWAAVMTYLVPTSVPPQPCPSVLGPPNRRATWGDTLA